MEVLTSFIFVIALIIIVKSMSKNTKKESELSLKKLVQKTFPKYKIIEKNQMIMICEITHRNEPDELVFIRISPNKNKKIKKSGRMFICDYPKTPTASEMKKDFGKYLWLLTHLRLSAQLRQK